MDISNKRRAESTKAMSEREQQHLAAIEAAEQAGRETRMRYETKVTEVEQTIKELVSRNQELSEQLAAYQALSEDLPGPGDELEIEAQSDRQQSLSARDENVKIRV